MRAQLKAIETDDYNSLESYRPQDPNHFAVGAILFIGPEGSDASAMFRTTICSPSGLAELVAERGIIIGDPLVILGEWDVPGIMQRIEKYCLHCWGETWMEIEPKLARLGVCEYEGYTQVKSTC